MSGGGFSVLIFMGACIIIVLETEQISAAILRCKPAAAGRQLICQADRL